MKVFEFILVDHSSKRALLKIMSKGFLYVGVTLTASTEQFENNITEMVRRLISAWRSC